MRRFHLGAASTADKNNIADPLIFLPAIP